MIRLSCFAAIAAAAVLTLTASDPASAQAAAGPSATEYPSRPVRIVVPFPPGGAVDAIARILADGLGKRWPHGVIVENRPGGSQIIGSQAVASAAPDGHTLLLATTGHAVNATLLDKLPYDPIKDFAPVALAATAPNILVVHPSVPATDFAGFVAHLRANPGKLTASHPGNGTTLHLGLEILKDVTGTAFVSVPYKGTAPALNAVLAHEVDFMFDVTAAVPHVRAGKLRALAVTGAGRATVLPEVPTLAESGLPGVEIVSWYGLLAPAGTPTAVQERIAREVADVLAQPAVRERVVGYGLEPAAPATPTAFSGFVGREVERWGKVIRAAGVTAN